MRDPRAILALASVAAVVACSARPRSAPAPVSSPCSALDQRTTIRRVQTSQAFLDALSAARRYYRGESFDALIPTFCSTMDTIASPTIAPRAVAFFAAPYGPDNALVKFGVTAQGVTFLNDTLDVPEPGELGPGLSLRAWNAFIQSAPPLAPLADTSQALRYACFVSSIASNSVTRDPCRWAGTPGIVRGTDGSYTVTVQGYGRPIRVTRDGRVLQLAEP